MGGRGGKGGETPSPLAVALRILSYRDRTARALGEKLAEKGLSPDEIASVMETLKRDGLLDDGRFAVELASSRIRNRNWGPIKISMDLVKKGVPQDIARRTVAGLDEAEVTEAARRAYKKWAGKRGLDRDRDLPREDYIRACRHLESRGFPRGLIMKVVRGGCGAPFEE